VEVEVFQTHMCGWNWSGWSSSGGGWRSSRSGGARSVRSGCDGSRCSGSNGRRSGTNGSCSANASNTFGGSFWRCVRTIRLF
ncbi:hypothetical protein GGF43_004753, partial [Coemansia sp. RSA 2618]